MQRATATAPTAPKESPPRSEAGILLEALRGLPTEHAEVVALAFFGELSHTEIAAHLGLSKDTVNGRMRLGLEKLQRDFEGNEPDVSSSSGGS